MNVLGDIVSANRAGERRGIPSFCTAHPETLSAIFAAYRDDDAPILIEATCNQVNQFGGYTGMNPAQFRSFVKNLAQREGVDPTRLILGGDHLGPNPWKGEPGEVAMAKARDMVAAYVAAGFTKIHLDASIACADDVALDDATMAARAAELCAVAEASAKTDLCYVIGTEVPIPGGETEVLHTLGVTAPEAAARTHELHREAFAARGLSAAFERVVGIVVQPGVDFGNAQVFAFAPEKAETLSRSVEALPGLVFEAHSTDYQSEGALSDLVAAHFAILKVGPELTFAFRQAVTALAHIEAALNLAEPSRILDVITAEMRANPHDWRAYVAADDREATMMLYGLSDRVRYYWPRPAIQAALTKLYENIAAARPEPGLVAQFTGRLVEARGEPADLPRDIIETMVGDVVRKYRAAAGD
ncbi:class II D-tagatose-bisphosphate aldolase non-catalytic subunit [Mesorhizobium sp. IMUNJ 23232]|uniref:class II D-tagatose-bisphosphate aldolase non-catalytic subunit n=1 Tax=Mesorhizobium sp. IMUNJ 23232 TaxID=3376064 RepID=UPI0037BD192F